MNERIKLLADEAAKFSAIMALPTGESGDNLFVEKFAELIVRECMLCCERVISDPVPKSVDTWLNGCINEIKEHFGVEE